MRRRGIGYVECVVFVMALMALLPILGQLGQQTFRSLDASERVLRLRQIAATCDRLRRDADAAGWSLHGEELLVGATRWSNRDGMVLRDGDRHLAAASLTWQARDDGCLLLRLEAQQAAPRELMLFPPEAP